MDIPFLIATTFLVSVDSFVCGISLSMQPKKTLPLYFSMTLTVLAICIVGGVFGKFLSGLLPYGGEILGGAVLITVGILNFCENNRSCTSGIDKNTLNKGISVGFAIGLDGGVATFSLVCMGYNPALIPTLVTITHIIMLTASSILSKTKIFKKLSGLKIIPPLIISTLGLVKIISALL